MSKQVLDTLYILWLSILTILFDVAICKTAEENCSIGKSGKYCIKIVYFSGHRHSRLHFFKRQIGLNQTSYWQNERIRQTSKAATFDGSYFYRHELSTFDHEYKYPNTALLHNTFTIVYLCNNVNISFSSHSMKNEKTFYRCYSQSFPYIILLQWFTVFENYSKSLILEHCERSELCFFS